MKYALIVAATLILAIGISVLAVFLINRKHHLKGYVKAIIIPASSLILIVCLSLTYFAFHYGASEKAKTYLHSDETVNVTNEKSWYRFDNQDSDEQAIVFYIGAKVDPVAYAPLASKISHGGVDVYLIKPPLYFPLFSLNAADEVAALNRHKDLYMMGHSLGGSTAAMYLSNAKSDAFKGIIFLASYSTKKIDDSFRCLSLYGTNDLVLNKAEYENNRMNLPINYQEIIIEGGNHAYFGDYGSQRGDGGASISQEEQISITSSAVIDFMESK